MCDQKDNDRDSKKKKAGHLHLIVTDKIDHLIGDDDYLDGNFNGWGSASLGSFMFQQIGMDIEEFFKRFLLNNIDMLEPLPIRSDVLQKQS
eukprot:988100-Ditylum_brightwellii.AAC.1